MQSVEGAVRNDLIASRVARLTRHCASVAAAKRIRPPKPEAVQVPTASPLPA